MITTCARAVPALSELDIREIVCDICGLPDDAPGDPPNHVISLLCLSAMLIELALLTQQQRRLVFQAMLPRLRNVEAGCALCIVDNRYVSWDGHETLLDLHTGRAVDKLTNPPQISLMLHTDSIVRRVWKGKRDGQCATAS